MTLLPFPSSQAGLAICAACLAVTLHAAPSRDADSSPADLFTPEQRAYWAFQPPERPPEPRTEAPAWIRNPIDAFVQERLAASGLQPAPTADKITLIRRATLDLTGLPPTPAEVRAFLADRAPGAFDRVVERLLASPHYGERWGAALA